MGHLLAVHFVLGRELKGGDCEQDMLLKSGTVFSITVWLPLFRLLPH